MTEEGEGTKEARKVVASEKEGKISALSGEGIIESVGILEVEGKFDAPLTSPHIIPYSSSSPTFLSQVSNMAAEIILVSENYGIEANNYGATETVHWRKGGR